MYMYCPFAFIIRVNISTDVLVSHNFYVASQSISLNDGFS